MALLFGRETQGGILSNSLINTLYPPSSASWVGSNHTHAHITGCIVEMGGKSGVLGNTNNTHTFLYIATNNTARIIY